MCTLAGVNLVVTTAARDRLDPLHGSEVREPSLRELASSVVDDAVWLTGGEPTLRADLPELIALWSDTKRVGLVTDGLALGDERGLMPLCDAGLRAVRVRLHAARRDAHDWLVAMRGAARRAMRAARRIRARGLELQLEARLARPTVHFAHELVELAHELGASAVHLHPVVVRNDAEDIALVARHGLIAPHVERAAELAHRRALTLAIHGFPRCMLPNVEVVGDAHPNAERCEDCNASCPGFHPDYLARFGDEELGSSSTAHIATVDFATEPTRIVRKRLVKIAGEGARVLRIVGGSMSHPAAAALLREATLLDFDAVEIVGVAHGLDRLSDAELYPLTGIDRIDGIFYGSDAASHDAAVGIAGAFECARRGLRRFREVTGRPARALFEEHEMKELLEEDA